MKKAFRVLGVFLLGIIGLCLFIYAWAEDVRWLQWLLVVPIFCVVFIKPLVELEQRFLDQHHKTREQLGSIENRLHEIGRSLDHLHRRLENRDR